MGKIGAHQERVFISRLYGLNVMYDLRTQLDLKDPEGSAINREIIFETTPLQCMRRGGGVWFIKCRIVRSSSNPKARKIEKQLDSQKIPI